MNDQAWRNQAFRAALAHFDHQVKFGRTDAGFGSFTLTPVKKITDPSFIFARTQE